MKISVIVPVYKVEQYIGKCIQSLLDQTYTNFEALIVDDGSPDHSIEIAKKMAGEDPRFIFLEKENGGVSSARNYGLDHAMGDYIAFLDPDDWYENNFLSLMMNQAINLSADIVICNINFVTSEGAIQYVLTEDAIAYYEKKDWLLYKHTIYGYIWNKLYKKSTCIQNMSFDEEIQTYEDMAFTFRVLYNKKIISCDHALYNYVQRVGAITKGVPKTLICDKKLILQYYQKFCSEKLGVYSDEFYVKSYINIYVLHTLILLEAQSKDLKKDLDMMKKNIDNTVFTYENILKYTHAKFSSISRLLLFKLSASTYTYLVYIKNKLKG